MLREIRQDALKFAKVIANTLDVDALVIDNTFSIIASTTRYFNDYEQIHKNTFIGKVISENRTVSVRDKSSLECCGACPRADDCPMQAFIGVPVLLDGAVVGAVAIILPHHRIDEVFSDEANSIAFVESMADLLQNKLEANAALRKLHAIRRERETLMDFLMDAYVSTDSMGYITYGNLRFRELFRLQASPVGQLFYDVVPHARLRELVEHPADIKSQLIFHKTDQDSFYGFLSCTRIFTDGQFTGISFRFRPLADARSSVINQANEPERDISFSWLAGRFFPEAVVHEAKRLAVTEKSILLQGERGCGKRMLARCMHNYSNRADHEMIFVECYREYREHVPKTIFGVLGKLQSAHESTVVFTDIERLPNALQLELVDFLKRPVLRHQGGPDLTVNIRFMFITTADLLQLTRRGLFCDELYYRISENVITVPPLRENPAFLRAQAAESLEYYRVANGNPGLHIPAETLERLCQYSWPGNLRELEAACDAIIFAGPELVSLDELLSAQAPKPPAPEPARSQTISQLEKQMIAQLLQSGDSKEKIAQTLGISRATLYRKIKNYSL